MAPRIVRSTTIIRFAKAERTQLIVLVVLSSDLEPAASLGKRAF